MIDQQCAVKKIHLYNVSEQLSTLIRKHSGYVPWEHTGHAFNMRTPDIYFVESDFYDSQILSRLEELEVVGCYIFVPLRDYSFLSNFTRLEDLYISHGYVYGKLEIQ